MTCAAFWGACALLSPARAYEADVHYGLVKWLAHKAGYTDWQAEAIALGDNRVDSGMPSTLEVVLEYACIGHYPDAARAIQARHYPSAQALPALPRDRIVVPGSPAARHVLDDTVGRATSQEAQYLGLLGAALHPLQDSWSHAGEPSIPVLAASLHCDPTLASGPPERAGAGAHGANVTFVAPDDVVAMANATYTELLKYPVIQGQARTAAQWADLVDKVKRFAIARTKTEKRKWFREQGFESTDFLAGISLPDGPSAGSLEPFDHAMPQLTQFASQQHDAPPGTKEFFDRLLARWLSNEPVETVVGEMSAFGTNAGGKKSTDLQAARERADLVALMKLWKMRDHGSVESLAHAPRPFSAKQLAKVRAITAKGDGYVSPSSPVDAFVPLVAKGKYVSPLLPYIVRTIPSDDATRPRVIAIARLKHTPYDTVGWIAERVGSEWRLVDMVAAVDQ